MSGTRLPQRLVADALARADELEAKIPEFECCAPNECYAPSLAILVADVRALAIALDGMLEERKKKDWQPLFDDLMALSDDDLAAVVYGLPMEQRATLSRLLRGQMVRIRTCPNCNGVGKVRDSMLISPVVCGRCDGRGTIEDKPPTDPDPVEEARARIASEFVDDLRWHYVEDAKHRLFVRAAKTDVERDALAADLVVCRGQAVQLRALIEEICKDSLEMPLNKVRSEDNDVAELFVAVRDILISMGAKE